MLERPSAGVAELTKCPGVSELTGRKWREQPSQERPSDGGAPQMAEHQSGDAMQMVVCCGGGGPSVWWSRNAKMVEGSK